MMRAARPAKRWHWTKVSQLLEETHRSIALGRA
jgi:hypothetical protein